jgi:uncharacterized protein
MNVLTISHVRDLTIEYGEGWAYPHVCRLLKLIEAIGQGLAYDQQVLIYAVYLHDWGAFPRYRQAGVDHALRSVQVAEKEILPNTTLSGPARQAVLEAIALHDYRNPRPAEAPEARLLREADILDMLGVIGMLRECSWGPRDLKICLGRILTCRAAIEGRFTLPLAQEMAAERLAHMQTVLELLEAESFGVL